MYGRPVKKYNKILYVYRYLLYCKIQNFIYKFYIYIVCIRRKTTKVCNRKPQDRYNFTRTQDKYTHTLIWCRIGKNINPTGM